MVDALTALIVAGMTMTIFKPLTGLYLLGVRRSVNYANNVYLPTTPRPVWLHNSCH